MTKYVREIAAAKSLSAWIVTKRGKHIATIQAHYTNSRVLVNIWHNDATPMQHGTASGYGYDKLTVALSGLSVDGHILSDHCGGRIAPGKLGYFPASYKPKRGYRLANYGQYDATGKRWHNYDLRDFAIEALGGAGDDDITIADEIQTIRKKLALVGGYSDCFKEAGLEHLTALGYTVIKAI